MDLDPHQILTDAEHTSFHDKKKNSSFLDRSKMGFKRENNSPRPGSSARDRVRGAWLFKGCLLMAKFREQPWYSGLQVNRSSD